MEKYCFGVDIGGTSIKLGLFDTQGSCVDKWSIPTNKEDNGASILADIAATIQDKMNEKSLTTDMVIGAGVGVPGPVENDTTVIRCVNIGWGVVNVGEQLSAALNIKVKVANDANIAALGEQFKGGGEGHRNIVMVTLGTGVGGGIILDGNILSGANGAAGEIGHIRMVDDEEDICGCGNKGCLEQYASATGIVRMTKKLLDQDKDCQSVLKSIEDFTAKDIFDAAKAGDQVGLKAVDDLGNMLAKALAAVSGTIDPEAYVIGGGVSNAGAILIDAIKKYYQIYAFHSCRDAQFLLAELGNDAGIYGGARMVLE